MALSLPSDSGYEPDEDDFATWLAPLCPLDRAMERGHAGAIEVLLRWYSGKWESLSTRLAKQTLRSSSGGGGAVPAAMYASMFAGSRSAAAAVLSIMLEGPMSPTPEQLSLPLTIAISRGAAGVAQALLDAGADVEAAAPWHEVKTLAIGCSLPQPPPGPSQLLKRFSACSILCSASLRLWVALLLLLLLIMMRMRMRMRMRMKMRMRIAMMMMMTMTIMLLLLLMMMMTTTMMMMMMMMMMMTTTMMMMMMTMTTMMMMMMMNDDNHNDDVDNHGDTDTDTDTDTDADADADADANSVAACCFYLSTYFYCAEPSGVGALREAAVRSSKVPEQPCLLCSSAPCRGRAAPPEANRPRDPKPLCGRGG